MYVMPIQQFSVMLTARDYLFIMFVWYLVLSQFQSIFSVCILNLSNAIESDGFWSYTHFVSRLGLESTIL